MKSLVICVIFVVALKWSFALPANSSAELDYDNYIDDDAYDDYTWEEGPLERMAVDDEDSDAEKDNFRQIIFNPRKRRERRRRHRAAYNELTSLDFCWRKHDECESIGTNDTKFGLTNKEEQRFWHCNCDTEFYTCLHRLNSTLSSHIGELYFTHNYRCYRHEFKIDDCIEFDNHKIYASQERCVQYVLNVRSRKSTQWFDLPFYDGKPPKRDMLVVRSKDNDSDKRDDDDESEENGDEDLDRNDVE